MKAHVALLAALFCLTACEKQPAEVTFTDPNVEMLDDGKAARYKTRPYTGTIRRTLSGPSRLISVSESMPSDCSNCVGVKPLPA